MVFEGEGLAMKKLLSIAFAVLTAGVVSASPARVTALLNGVVVQNDFELRGMTEYIGEPTYRAHGALPILLQAHGDPSPPISFRNIWLRELP